MVFTDNCNFNLICRTCLSNTRDLCSLYLKDETFSSRLFDMVIACSSIKVGNHIFIFGMFKKKFMLAHGK